jgi:shikimate dehydrogenase
MYPNNGETPLDVGCLDGYEAVIDLIYNPCKTELMLCAEELGIPVFGGLPMLVAQAKKAAELFTGAAIDDELINRITDKINKIQRNIILIGMPGCGKTSIGKEIAEITGRPFIDTDDGIVDILREHGEAEFRKAETTALSEAAKKSGCVIATGGGIVKNPHNQRLMRQNGVIIYLDRPINELPLDGRPISLQHGVEALARERLPLYEKWCDYAVRVNGVEKTAKEIIGLLT